MPIRQLQWLRRRTLRYGGEQTVPVGAIFDASNNLDDQNGMGAVTYHWFADGVDVAQGASWTGIACNEAYCEGWYTDQDGFSHSGSQVRSASFGPIVNP